MTNVILGGTFDVFHVGHEALLAKALEVGDGRVFVGVTSDGLANAHRDRRVRPFEERAGSVRRFLKEREGLERVEVGRINDPIGRGREGGWDAIVVTPDTLAGGERINAVRKERGLPPLGVHVAPMVLAEDGRPVSATRIRHGDIDPRGRLPGPVRVAIGSANPVKVRAVERVLREVKGVVDARGYDVASGVPDQPLGDETWQGAAARAAAALAEWPDAHFGVGIEAGLFHSDWGDLDVQCCVILDAGGRVTAGQGAGFAHPPVVVEVVEAGHSVGDAFEVLTGDADIGRNAGAIGHLTKGLLDRETLTAQAVVAAWVPRMRPRLHELAGAPPDS